MIYSCKPLFERIKAQVAAEIDNFPLEDPPTVCIITTGDDEPSARYVRNKLRDFEELGIIARVAQMKDPEEMQKYLVMEAFAFDGVIVQRPIELHGMSHKEAADMVANWILPDTDIDGVTYKSPFLPPSVRGLDLLLHEWDYDPSGKTAVVIGRGDVGKPVAEYLLGRDATVTITHSKTKDVDRSGICVRADIVVGAAGLETPIRVFTRDYNGMIFDYGITKNADTGVLHGDIDCNCTVLCKCQTSVPGGMGLMVRAALLLNVLDAYKRRRGLM